MHYLMEYIYLYNLSDGKTNQSYMYKLVRTFCQNYNFKFTETLWSSFLTLESQITNTIEFRWRRHDDHCKSL